jgi:hypothetical protein
MMHQTASYGGAIPRLFTNRLAPLGSCKIPTTGQIHPNGVHNMGVTVLHHDLTEALERSGWGEKRRAGAKKRAVKRAHIRQTVSGLELSAPNGVHAIAIIVGKWPKEVFFDGAMLSSILKWLQTYDGAKDTVEIELIGAEIIFQIGTARRRVNALSEPMDPPSAPEVTNTRQSPSVSAKQPVKAHKPASCSPSAPTPEPPTRKPAIADVRTQAIKEIEEAYPELKTRNDERASYILPLMYAALVLVAYRGALQAFETPAVAELVTLAASAGILWLLNRERHQKFDRLMKERVEYLKHSMGVDET